MNDARRSIDRWWHSECVKARADLRSKFELLKQQWYGPVAPISNLMCNNYSLYMAFRVGLFVALLITCVCSIEEALSRSFPKKSIVLPSVWTHRTWRQEATWYRDDGRLFTRHGMERRKGNTIRRLGVRLSMSPWSQFEWQRYDGGIDVDKRLTRRLFVYTIAEVAWRSKYELDHKDNNNYTHIPAWRRIIVFEVALHMW